MTDKNPDQYVREECRCGATLTVQNVRRWSTVHANWVERHNTCLRKAIGPVGATSDYPLAWDINQSTRPGWTT